MVSGRPWPERIFGDAEIAALFADEATFARYLRFEVALARALADAGLAGRGEADAVAAGAKSFVVDHERIEAGARRDGLPVPEWVRQFRAHIGPDGADLVHRGATSQDLIDTAAAEAYVAALDILSARLSVLLDELTRLAARFGEERLMAVTRMQPALPIRVADRVCAWRRPLERAREDLPALRQDLAVLQFGGPVGTLDSFGTKGPEVAAGLARRLDLRWPGHAWHTDRAAFALLAEFLSRLTGALGKIGQDIALMALVGPEAIEIAGTGGSSAMPHKQNPVAAERLVALARFNATQLSAVHHALVHELERSGAAWSLEWLVLPKMAEAAAAALADAGDLIRAIRSMGDERP